MNRHLMRSGINYLGSLYRSRITPVPLYVNLFYTRLCNLRCEFCATIKRPSSHSLTLDQWKECSDILYSMGNRFISITGGEPLSRPDLPDFIRHLSRKNVLHSVITNGTLLNEKKLKELAEAGLMHLGVSTQSLIPGKHVKTQKKELFDLLIKYKQKYGFEVSALITLTRDNIEEVPQITQYLQLHGINVAPNIVTSGQGDWWFRSYCPQSTFGKKDLPKLKKTLDSLAKYPNVLYSGSYLSDVFKYAQGLRPFSCEAGTSYFSINDDGFVMPCQDFAPTKIHFTQLPQKYPLKKPVCVDCMWPCYYEETYKKSHPLEFIIKSLKTFH